MKCKIDCNKCLRDNPDLFRQAYMIIATLERKNPNIIKIVNAYCPNLSVCPECQIDDFVHMEGCKIDKELEVK